MKCPFCSSPETQVIDSRVSEAGDSIRRRRKCSACQKRFTTYETVELRLPQVVKTDGIARRFRRAEDPRRLPARAAQAAGAHRVRRRGDRPHRASRCCARRARDAGARHRRDGDAGALQARQGRATSASRRSIARSRTSSDFRDALEEVESSGASACAALMSAQAFGDADRAAHGARAGACRAGPLHDDAESARGLRHRRATASVIGEGWHERAGEAHAEVVALRDAARTRRRCRAARRCT